MRQRDSRQLDRRQTPIEQVPIPPKGRDKLLPVLRGLQWIFQTPGIKEHIFQLLEQRVKGGKQSTGRPGMDLWHVLVLGVVRLALDCDYDRLEYLVHYGTLRRRIMGLESHFRGEFGKGFHQKTLSENVGHVDEALLAEINAIVVKAGRVVLEKQDDEPLRAKSDTHVLETNVHFPTDLNLLWAELGDAPGRWASWSHLQAQAGTVPLTRQSGKSCVVRFRVVCNKYLRQAIWQLAIHSVRQSEWGAKPYYQQCRARGHQHNQALRALGAKWLKIIFRMCQHQVPYDESYHLANMTRQDRRATA